MARDFTKRRKATVHGYWRLQTVLIVMLTIGCSVPSADTIPLTRLKVKERKLEEAEAAAKRGIASGQNVDEWRILAAEIAIRRGQRRACLDQMHRLSSHPNVVCSAPLVDLGQLALDRGFAKIAETAFRAALSAEPNNSLAIFNLGFLLGFEGRSWEAAHCQFQTVRSGQFTPQHLVFLGAGEPVIEHPEMRELFANAAPDDPLPRLGEARAAVRRQEFRVAEGILRQIIDVDPNCGEAQGQLGRLLEPGDPERFLQWNSRVPTAAEFHPEVWVARGLWARQQGEFNGAIRCLWEAIQRDANHRVAHFQLGQILMLVNRPEEAPPFLLRAKHLQELAALVDNVVQNPTDLARMRRAMELTEELGRPVEAWGWAFGAQQVDRSCKWAQESQTRLRPTLLTATTQVREEAQLFRTADFSALPLPDLSRVVTPRRESADTPQTASALIRFEDESHASGLNFTYHSRSPDVSGDMRMYETTGGGVAVLDYDGDHFPDLFFTQAGSVDPLKQPRDWTDRCYRNLGGNRWQDVTPASGLSDFDYGQGATAGDFDNDGFTDLYVANLGRNRLYHNRGDGTFRDVTDFAGLTSERWTTSCLIADLNNDGWPDLYDVNYLSREDAIRTACLAGDEQRGCSPDTFAAEQDQLYLNLGDGHFRDITEISGIERPLGKGMGIIAADFDGSSRLSLFIANDAVPNFFFENRTSPNGSTPTFVESALQKGLALDAEGLPQACMGVAAGDFDGDRLLDLFVTNFYEQSNTLYLQRQGVMFEDATRPAGLREPSWRFLGFGTQELDADLDGWPDIVVTNGHVLDLTAKGIPFQMRPQFFRNAGQGHFRELTADQLGTYFQREYLGRGLARLDWNRDGLPDFVVSNIRAPAALVTNRTKNAGKSFAVRLVGVNGSRDATGAEVTVSIGDRTWTKQLVGGDGYQCRNENKVVFGLGSAPFIDRWSIRWSSDHTTTYGGITTGCEVMAVENKPVPLNLP